jgi:hypothetical protein
MVEYKQNVMFDPRQEAEAKRKRMLAEVLVQKGNAEQKNEQAGGMTVARSPLEYVNQLTQKVAGEYELGQADKMDSEVAQSRQRLMGEALGQLKDNPQGAAQLLSQDPSMMGDSLKLYGDALNRDRAEALQREGWANQRALQNMPTADMRNFDYYNSLSPEQQQAFTQYNSIGKTSNIPAPMQTANRMWELEQIARDPNRSVQERLDAETQYNLLGQTQKTYGFAGGVEKKFGINNPNDATNNMPQPVQGGQELNMSMMPKYANQPNAQMPVYSQPVAQPIAGYGGAVADIAGQKKAAEELAKKENAAMPAAIVQEQNDLVDKVNVAQGLEAGMNKFVSQIDGGQLDLGLMANLESMARNNVGMSTEQSRNLGSFKTQLERLRNESLRLNSGVQTDGDAQRAWNELISSISDPQFVRQRLTEIAEINRKGAQLQNQKLNLMRNEYGRGELNIPNINQQPNATQGGANYKSKYGLE